ncbi:chemotaxis protein CheB [Lewinella sp. JB7]|uniref:chemotaxis protein CheB n=1 Tax=Lewinella sp. JB7 TaxID=2962887 RepID=UPI0020C9F430|nr:chemotaxis protein CheB [Lewinella sp. JB7]MCP9235671.1 chemotaxis protein CheB [Lewinella sp. JB7]
MQTLHPNYRNIVVVGASAGGLEAILELVRPLPADLPAAIFIVQHMPPYRVSRLDAILRDHTALRVETGENGEEIRPGTIYLPQADRHLLVENDRLVISKGPRENRFRPAVDTLFRAAAYAYFERVVGIVLSGALNDGTSGMWTIKRQGGVAIVQDPAEAAFADMPEGVMRYCEVDYCLPAARIGELLGTLCRQEIVPAKESAALSDRELLQIEIEIAKGRNGLNMGILDHGGASPLTCPECHGALTQFVEGKLIRFRCHTGHAHTAESLITSLRDEVEKTMWELMRGLEESRLLLERMADRLPDGGNDNTAAEYRKSARQYEQQALQVQRFIRSSDQSDHAMGIKHNSILPEA